MTGVNRSTRRTCASAALSTTNPIWTVLGVNPVCRLNTAVDMKIILYYIQIHIFCSSQRTQCGSIRKKDDSANAV